MKTAKMTKIALAALVVLGLCGSLWAGWSTPVPVSEVNTEYADSSPFLSFDGLTLYFRRAETDTFYYTRIYQATRPVPSGPFTSVQNISTLNYSGGHVSQPWVSADNLRMYYYRTEPGSIWRMKLSERASTSDLWPAGVNISELNALGNVSAPSLTEDELTIVFVGYNVPGNLGTYDIWTANRPDWSTPFGNIRHLTEINTTAADGSPHILSDGLTLYFSSNRNGPSQIFKATRNSLSEPFGNLEHLSFFDTPGRQSGSPCPSYDGKSFYFGSALEGKPSDIYVSYSTTDTGPVAHWKFDEGTGSVAYDSAGDNDGTISGAVWTTGIIDGALDFDGVDDYVEVTDDDSLDITNRITISSWIRPFVELDNQFIVAKWQDSEIDSSYGCRLEYSNLKFFLAKDNTKTSKAFSDLVVATNTWNHVVVTLDGSLMKGYLNGIVSSETEYFAGPINVTSEPLEIGYNPGHGGGAGGAYFNGSIDDVRIYDRALSAVEIEELYNSVPVPPAAKTYYVDGVNGSDLNDGKSRETAFATIQKGIDTATDGNSVLVYPAVYDEALLINNKAIRLQGVATSAGIPIVQKAGDYAVSYYVTEGPDSLLKNFVIRGSDLGIFIVGGAPTISNVTIVDNVFGIAAYAAAAQPDISNCILWNNADGDLFGDPEPLEARYSFVEEEIGEPTISGLISHWKLDEGSGTTAYDSAGINDGTIYGATWTTGIIDGALDFDGVDDYVALPDNEPVWLPQNNFTLAAWVYPVDYVGAKILDLNFTASANPDYDQGYAVGRNNSGQISFEMNTTTTPDENTRTNDALVTGRWYHIVALRNSTTQAIYLDGQLNVSRTCASAPIDFVGGYDDDRVSIGRVTTNIVNDLYFAGKIDDVRIFDRALSDEEIGRLYQPLGGPLITDDYHLRSERGRHWPEHDVWVLDKVTSPCVDGGDPAVEPWNEPMPNGGRINMGAYGNTAYASMSEWPIAEDHNRDGIVNMKDIAKLAARWLEKLDWVE